MDKIVAEVTRAGNVVRQLRDFFRTGSGRIAPLEVRRVVASGAPTTAQPRLIGIIYAGGSIARRSMPRVLADRIQVETVLHNLISNAIDALKTIGEDQREIVVSAAIDSPQFVRLNVVDSGPGVPDEIAAQLFRPFATDKPQGMGLGLAISRSIVEARGGRLWLQAAGRGSMFSFTLPSAGYRMSASRRARRVHRRRRSTLSAIRSGCCWGCEAMLRAASSSGSDFLTAIER